MTTLVTNRIKKINNILSREQTQILEAAFSLMLPSLLTKITGQLFNLIAASYFGTEDKGWNQFLLASSIPELLTNVLLIGALGSIVIPILIDCKSKEGNEKFYRVYSSIINASMLTFGLVALVLSIGANVFLPTLLRLFASDVNTAITDQDMTQIVNMMRVMLIPQVILGLSVFISSGINVYDRLIIPNLAPLFYNIGRIFAVVALVPAMDFSPWAIVWGTVLGSILHLCVQLPLFRSLKIDYKFIIDWRSKYLREIGVLGIPRMFAIASEHIALTFNKFLAFGFSNGTAALFYANSLSLVIPTLFGYTFSYASFPTIARHFVANEEKEIKFIVTKTLNEILFFALPFTVIFMVMRVPLVRLSFGLLPGTNFSLNDSYLVSWILMWFSISWVFVSGRWFVYRLFYAAKDTMIPFVVSFLGLILTIILSVLFVNLFSHNSVYAVYDIRLNLDNLLTRSDSAAGVGGVALAMSISYTFEFFVLFALFHFKKVKLDLSYLFDSISRKLIAGGIMLVVMYFMYKTWNILSYLPDRAVASYTGSTTINLSVMTGLTVTTGGLVYLLICRLLKVDEVKIVKRYLRHLKRKLFVHST